MADRRTIKFKRVSTCVGVILITALHYKEFSFYSSLNIVCVAPFLCIQFLTQIVLFFFFFCTVWSTSAQSIFVTTFIMVWTIDRVFCNHIEILYLSMIVTLLTVATCTNEKLQIWVHPCRSSRYGLAISSHFCDRVRRVKLLSCKCIDTTTVRYQVNNTSCCNRGLNLNTNVFHLKK